MKIHIMTATLALAFASCQKPIASNDEPSPVESTPRPATPEPATPAPPPPPVAVATPPAPPAPQLAPPGVFYLLSAARVETSDGIRGLPPGTGVKLVRPGIYLTPAGEAALRDDQVTNNMTLARQVRDADLAAQERVKRGLGAQAAIAEAAQAARDAMPAITPSPSASPVTAPMVPKSTALDSPTIGAKGAAKSSVHWNKDVNGREYYVGSYGQRVYR